MSPTAALLNAYRNSRYQVDLPGAVCILQIGHRSAPMETFFRSENLSQACFVSAHNPRSVLLPMAINRTRHAALEQILIARKLRYLTGVGLATETMPAWPPEPGFFVLNISASAASSLGRCMDQHAVVYVEYGEPITLLLCAE